MVTALSPRQGAPHQGSPLSEAGPQSEHVHQTGYEGLHVLLVRGHGLNERGKAQRHGPLYRLDKGGGAV